MAQYHYERLSARSASFLLVESARSFSHSSTIQIYERDPARAGSGGVEISRIRDLIETQIPERYRMKLKWIPFEDYPVWVDDSDFHLDYHVRHTSLPRPGDVEQLERLVGRIQSQRLDRNRPLWECWVIEGLEDDRFALALKAHHCLVDDPTAPDLLEAMLTPGPRTEAVEVEPYRPRPAPSSLELARDEVTRRVRLPRRAVRRFRDHARNSLGLRAELQRRAEAVARLAGFTLRDTATSPLGGRIGPHRRFHHRMVPLEHAVSASRKLGGSVNDVILTTVAGALRTFLKTRYVNPATLDLRISLPIRTGQGSGDDAYARWVVQLPVWERDPVRRHALVREQTKALQKEQPAIAASTLFSAAEWTGSRLLSMGARALATHAPADLELTYIPGPEVALFLGDAKLLESYGQAPLRRGNALGIGVVSYEGRLCWGLNADYDRIPDLPDLGEALAEALKELRQASLRSARHLEVVTTS